MSYKIPIGPYHPALEEPYKIELTCEGEVVRDATQQVQFNSRAVEWLAERRNYIQNITLVERVCGICSHVHTHCFCMAVEELAGLHPPERAQYIRVIMAELERLHSHLLWTGLAADVMGFQTVFMTCLALRERLMDTLETISGNRVNYSMNCIGGVNRDIVDLELVLSTVRHLAQETERTLIPIFSTDRTIKARCTGVGILSREQAIAWGAVGPTARASGVSQDIRRDAPYAVYDKIQFDVPENKSGDVMARVVVRLHEMLQSCRIVEQAVSHIPPGPIHGRDFVEVPPGEAVARVEAPRGECFYYVASDGSDTPTRVKIRTPSFMNMPTVGIMAQGANLSEVPLIQASIDPCYSCTSR